MKNHLWAICAVVFLTVFLAASSAGAIVIIVEKSFAPSLEFLVFANFLKDRIQAEYSSGNFQIIHEILLEERGQLIRILSVSGLKNSWKPIWEVKKDDIQIPADFLRQANKAVEILLHYLQKRDLEQSNKITSLAVD